MEGPHGKAKQLGQSHSQSGQAFIGKRESLVMDFL